MYNTNNKRWITIELLHPIVPCAIESTNRNVNCRTTRFDNVVKNTLEKYSKYRPRMAMKSALNPEIKTRYKYIVYADVMGFDKM